MKVTDINSRTLNVLLSLAKKKERLTKRIAEIDKQVVALSSGEVDLATRILREVASKRRRSSTRNGADKGPKKPRSPKGFMQEQITKLLHEAGHIGMTAKDLAHRVEKPVNQVQVWFSSTGKKLGIFEKSPEGHWRIRLGHASPAPAHSEHASH